ncbi:MAG TPA: ribonucleoside-diphosphate reductase, adenosylcobalamin-dependent, partial [Methanobacterium sp.]|nr:ribonucleoside-diphosphate reductase, adenosylcobalamin-dependent [Methanobacterium sp.]
LKSVVETAVHFLDNVIDVNNFPISKVETETLKNRKIGLGIMGFAEMLIMLEIPYDSQDALDTAEEIMSFITYHARKVSAELGKLRGSFPNFKGSTYDKDGFSTMRNATVTTIAPTGTISIIADVTSGIEPMFAVSFIRDVMEGEKLLEVNKLFEETAKKEGFYSEELMTEIAKKGSIQNIGEINENIKRIFPTAHEINPEWHVKMQAAFQKYVDNAVSKTVNLPESASPEDVKEIMLMAYKLKCKGITVYRYGSKKQVLYLNSYHDDNKKYLNVDSEYSGGCPSFKCPF